MNFSELKTELAARGFDYLSDTRLGRYINFACVEVDEPEDGMLWPYREASVTGVPPIAIADLGVVEMVTNATTNCPITPADYRTLVERHGDLSTAGTPCHWYTGTPAGVQELATYPVSTASINVQYYRVPPTLVSDGDIPLAPVRFHNVYVDVAVRMAYRDSDNHQEAALLQAEIDKTLNRMRMAMLTRQVQADTQVEVRGGEGH